MSPIVRQAGILLREVIKFRDENGHTNWPCILAGGKQPSPPPHIPTPNPPTDFNFPPNDPAYSLLTGDPLLPDKEDRLSKSRVVHISVDPTVPLTAPKAPAEDEEGAETDPDNVITNARAAGAADGLLSSSELAELFASPVRPKSAYDEGQRLIAERTGGVIERCGERLGVPTNRRGAFEPEWTSYTHYWKTVLDYIFVIDPPHRTSSVLRLLKPHATDDLHPGLPKKGVSGSDHVSLAAELQWPAPP